MESVKLRRLRAAAAAAAILLIGGGLAWSRHKKKKAAAGPAPDAARASRGDVEVRFTDSGELAPKSFVDVASKVSGRVTELLVEEGRSVRKGDRLAVIQPGRTEAEGYVPFTVTSPLAGVVMRYQKPGNYQEEARLARLGDYAAGLLDSNTPTYLMTVADLTRLVVKMKISEMDILKLKEAMVVAVTVDALPGETFPAKISLVSPQADKDNNNLKTFKVEVTLDRNDPRLKPGMTARVDGLLDARRGVLKVPLAAVFEEAGKDLVYAKGAAGKPAKAPVKLGLRSETEVEVLEGIAEGAELLTEKPSEEPKKP